MDFASGLGTVLGIKVDGSGLWVLNNAESESALIHYDLASGRVIRKYTVVGSGHSFNDLVIAATRATYISPIHVPAQPFGGWPRTPPI